MKIQKTRGGYDKTTWNKYCQEILKDPKTGKINPWQDFATIRRWRKRLAIHSKQGELAEGTWQAVEYCMPRFLVFTWKTPDDIIETTLSNNEHGEELIFNFNKWLKDIGIGAASAHTIAHGTIRGFFKHNQIPSKHWHTPQTPPSEVKKSDANYPLWIITNETGKKKIHPNRPLIQDFLSRLNYRDQLIALMLKDLGQDSGDVLDLTLSFVRSQDPNHKRLYLSSYRNKNGEILDNFITVETTPRIRQYERTERSDSPDSDPLFVTTLAERKRQFKAIQGREYTIADKDLLPPAKKITPGIISESFRRAAENMGVKLEKGKQSPFRPKRWRHFFRQACQHGGIGDDMTDVFQGRKATSSKEYEPKSREELEFYYETGPEPYLQVYSEPSEKSENVTKLQEDLDSMKKDKEEQMQKMENMDFNLQQLQVEVGILRRGERSNEKVIRTANTIMYKNRKKISGLEMKRPDPEYFVKDKDLEKNYSKIYDIDSYAFEMQKKLENKDNSEN